MSRMATASGSSAASVAPDQRSPTGVRAASKSWHPVHRTSLPGRPMAWAACRTADTGMPPAGALAAGADPEDPFVDILPAINDRDCNCHGTLGGHVGFCA